MLSHLRLAMPVITEGNVSSNILSYSEAEFLFTSTVCKSWKENSNSTCTNITSTFESASRMEEALLSGLNTEYLFDLAVVFGAGIPVLQRLSHIGPLLSVTMRYAAFHGKMDVVQCIQNTCLPEIPGYDQYDLFEAIRGGHLFVVKQLLQDEECRDDCNIIPEWPSRELERYPADDEHFILHRSGTHGELWLLRRCLRFFPNQVEADELVGNFLDDEFYHPEDHISCMELAIRKNRLDIVKVLREAGGHFSDGMEATIGSFALAMRGRDIDMLRYLKDEGCVVGEYTLYESLGENSDISVIEFVLQNKWVGMCSGCLHMAIYCGRHDIIGLLLKFGAPVTDDTIDEAISKREFALARKLLHSHGCRPTPRAYEFVLTGGSSEDVLHEEGITIDKPDSFYLEKLSWVYSTGCKIGFDSFADMQADWKWLIIFPYFSEAVLDWFRGHITQV